MWHSIGGTVPGLAFRLGVAVLLKRAYLSQGNAAISTDWNEF